MISPDRADLELLSLASNVDGLFALSVDYRASRPTMGAVNRAASAGWIALVDVRYPEVAPTQLCRIFILTQAGRDRLSDLRKAAAA